MYIYIIYTIYLFIRFGDYVGQEDITVFPRITIILILFKYDKKQGKCRQVIETTLFAAISVFLRT